MAMLFVLFLSVDVSGFASLRDNARFACVSALLNFMLTPIVAYALGIAFFDGNLDVRIGLLMLLVTPCTDWYLIFTRLGGGNVELGLSILPMNLVLQVLLLPVYLTLFFGTSGVVEVGTLLADTAVLLLVPLSAAVICRCAIRGRERIRSEISRRGDGAQFVLLIMAVLFMFATEGQEAMNQPILLLELFIPLSVFFLLLFLVARFTGQLVGFSEHDTISLIFTTMARNSPVALAIAVAVFPDQPLISLALVIGPLIELPVLSVTSWYTRNRMSQTA